MTGRMIKTAQEVNLGSDINAPHDFIEATILKSLGVHLFKMI